MAGNGPDDAFVIEELPFSTTGDSTGFTSTVSLGFGPDVFYTFTSATEVKRKWEFPKSRVLKLKNVA